MPKIMPAKDRVPLDFDSISISVASPEEISTWSHGEVKKPETINYRTQKPEREGLFCEKIFGPTKNWECYCGKYKRIRYKGVICEKCGVEVTRSIVRRERMGHIKLAVPVTHIWFLRSTPSRLGLLLDLPIKAIEQVVYFASYVITQIDEKGKEEAKLQITEEYKNFKEKISGEYHEKIRDIKKEKIDSKVMQTKVDQLEKDTAKKLSELDEQHLQAKDELNALRVGKVFSELDYRDMSMKFGHIFTAGIGAEAIRKIIEQTDLRKLLESQSLDLKKSSGQKQKKIIKRLKLISSLLKADIKPEWMILTSLPVIPPDLRPMVQLDGGRFAASDLNDLYRRVINRNNRLKRLMSIGAPEVICRNEKRMLQEAVDTLLNNSARQGKTVFSAGDRRKLRSLSDMLKGKQGRFRQNLLGKRVDYSGRSVIVVGPQLKLHQCGLPKQMALELFKPFVIGHLIREGYAHNIKNAEKLMNQGKREIWDILEKITIAHYVLLNRAPTLHRLGIQAFQPILVEGKAIQVHPLVCTAFNADFDGDQMAVHVPLSFQAQREARELMLSSKNLLKPSAGEPITTATQDMILGCYYLTKMTADKKGQGMCFSDIAEAMLAYQLGHVHLQSKITVRLPDQPGLVETTIGRVIFNSVIPKELGFWNKTMDKKQLKEIISESYEKCSQEQTAVLSDEIKRIGFQYATESGLSISSSNMIIPPEKNQLIDEASEKVKKINNQYWKGFVTEEERYLHTIKIWSEAKSKVTVTMINAISDDNDIAYMINSGARGNWGQITQLCGLKGLVANPAGRTIELPIKSNLKEGFTILEYFIATHGGRKGKSDTALKTAEAGYLTRRLVDAVQDIIIKEKDCGSIHAHKITRSQSNLIGVPWELRIYGRVLAADVRDPKTNKIIVNKSVEIDKNTVEILQKHNIEEVEVKSIMTCQTKNGVCQMCYGRDLGTNKTVDIGTAVGIIAAQSIGEPGTQLTMRTFHMGGVAEGQDITQGLTRVEELFEARTPKKPAILSEIKGKVKINRHHDHTEIEIDSEGPAEVTIPLPPEFDIVVKKGDKLGPKSPLGVCEETKKTFRVEETGTVIDLTDHSVIIRTNQSIKKQYLIPFGKTVKVKTGQMVDKGTPLTSGHLDLRQLLQLTDIYNVENYILSEVQNIYASQGQNINDKHIEIIARQMLSKVRILDPGESTKCLPGEIVNILHFESDCAELRKKKKKLPYGERLLLGLTRIALYTDSWLSAASFQETIRVLVEAATTNRIDRLEGLKENVIIGKLIPAGETYRRNLIEGKK